MPFRDRFDCLWCGRAHAVRGPDDIEGWAQLCPDCVGRAGENEFLRFRLRAALTERSGADAGSAAGPPGEGRVPERRRAEPAPSAADEEDWYLRRGRFDRGSIEATAWQAELDAASTWLDGLPLGGTIVELAAGTGWWSPILAGKGELWALDAEPAALDRARERLLAHGLRAHLHIRDPWAEPDRLVDAVVVSPGLGRVAAARLLELASLVARWLRPGGHVAFLAADVAGPVVGQPATVEDRAAAVAAALQAAGFIAVEPTTTDRSLALVSGRRPGGD